jgi:hypothetical protein
LSAGRTGTIRTHRARYLQWCDAVGLGDNPLLIDVVQQRRIVQFLSYAEFLCSGGSYHFTCVLGSTIDRYLLAAATLVASATGHDPRKTLPTDKNNAPCIKALLDAYKRWEGMPNRREPWTPELQRNMDDFVAQQHTDGFTLIDVLADFTATGLYTGCRVSEYAQTSGANRRVGGHAIDPLDMSPIAFTLNDIVFFRGKRTIPINDLISCNTMGEALLLVDYVTVTWTTQKNGIRGEEKSFHKNNKCQGLCPVNRFLSIVLRFVKLMGIRTDIPLTVYKGSTGQLLNVIRTDIDGALQAAAIRLFQLDPIRDKKTISRWTTHSIRVGACNILFGARIQYSFDCGGAASRS